MPRVRHPRGHIPSMHQRYFRRGRRYLRNTRRARNLRMRGPRQRQFTPMGFLGAGNAPALM